MFASKFGRSKKYSWLDKQVLQFGTNQPKLYSHLPDLFLSRKQRRSTNSWTPLHLWLFDVKSGTKNTRGLLCGNIKCVMLLAGLCWDNTHVSAQSSYITQRQSGAIEIFFSHPFCVCDYNKIIIIIKFEIKHSSFRDIASLWASEAAYYFSILPVWLGIVELISFSE